jgi:hypothetical protein
VITPKAPDLPACEAVHHFLGACVLHVDHIGHHRAARDDPNSVMTWPHHGGAQVLRVGAGTTP